MPTDSSYTAWIAVGELGVVTLPLGDGVRGVIGAEGGAGHLQQHTGTLDVALVDFSAWMNG